MTRRYHRDHLGQFAETDEASATAPRVDVTTRRADGSLHTERGGGAVYTTGGRTDLPEGVRMVPTEQLRQQIKYGTDGFAYSRDSEWERLRERQRNLPRDESMRRDVMENGMQPIRVVFDEVPMGGGQYETHGEILNGNHRLALALEMGIEEMPVSTRDMEDWHGTERVGIQVRLTNPPDWHRNGTAPPAWTEMRDPNWGN